MSLETVNNGGTVTGQVGSEVASLRPVLRDTLNKNSATADGFSIKCQNWNAGLVS